MGGGDLNLKKSWHPSTLRNIERVWKAEQKHEAEQQKIEQLQKELAAERSRDEMRTYAEDQGVVKKRDERLDWMYQGPAAMVNRDDYLLGRKIDKTFEMLQMQEKGADPTKEESGQPSSLFRLGSSASDVTVDLATKIREDPLFTIMKKEKEQRKNLLMNPVKMKQLQAMLKDTIKKDKKKKKKTKKSKKSKNKHESDSSSSSSSSDSDTVQEISRAENREKRSQYEQKDRREDRSYHNEDRYLKGRRYHEEYEIRREKYKREHDGDRKRQNDYDGDRKRQNDYDGDRKRQNDYDEYDENRRTKYRKEAGRGQERENVYEKKNSYNSKSSFQKPKTEKKMSAEEKERLRQEMMENARWREKQREKNVKRYVKEGEREDRVGEGSASIFIQPMLSKAAERGTVENRVKQKIFTIQRNKSDMDRNFARR